MGKLVFASVISNIEQSKNFMTVKARICETPAANLNGARVTQGFIDEIVSNCSRYVGLPLYADIKALTNGNYDRLGHLYDVRTGEFHSTQIGSFYQFEKEEFNEGCYLVGYVRIPKRNKKLSDSIIELWRNNNLKFSFEVSVGEYSVLDDDTILIDAAENNFLEGTAIVSYPACEDAVALELVAQKTENAQGGETEMADKVITEVAEEVVSEEVKEQVEEVAEAKEEVAKVEEAEETEVQAEETKVEEPEEKVEEAACKDDDKKENAEVYVREEHVTEDSVHAFDSDTGEEIHQNVRITTEECHVEDGTIVETPNGVQVAEADGDSSDSSGETTPGSVADEPGAEEVPADAPVSEETPDDGVVPASDASESKKMAELIAEMQNTINELKSEIAELKERKVVAEAKKVTAEVNPFVDSIQAPVSEYNLLTKAEKNFSYSLLEKY